MKTKKILVAGIGNSFRCDDRAGLLVCDLIEDALNGSPLNPVIEIKKLSGEGAELIQEWENYKIVFLADASRNFGNPGKITRIDTADTPLQQDYFHYSSHNFSLAEAVELARRINRLPERLIVYAIEGDNFSYGLDLSYEVELACLSTARKILEEIIYIPEKFSTY